MPISEAKKASNKKWNDANMKERYDRIQLVVPKGQKETIQARASSQGESVNAFVTTAIDERIARLDGSQAPMASAPAIATASPFESTQIPPKEPTT